MVLSAAERQPLASAGVVATRSAGNNENNTLVPLRASGSSVRKKNSRGSPRAPRYVR